MSSLSGASAIAVGLLVIVGVLAAALYWVQRSQGGQQRRPAGKRKLPQQWPVVPRPLANSVERHVWLWLREVFADHHVMVKLPLTRFTMPRDKVEAAEWFDLLSGAYCAFTVCNNAGHVVGCVDIMGPRQLSRGNRQLKQTLLAQCGIAYWVLSPESLPEPHALRAEFLGASDSLPPQRPSEHARLEEARTQLHEALDRNRNYRHQRMMSGADHDTADAQVTPWPQADSFLGTLDDSRRAPLTNH